MYKVSVIICTHNPNMVYLNRVISALKMQTLTHHDWELIIVNNGSTNNFEEVIEVDWKTEFKLVHEPKLGLTHARIKGITEARGHLLIFVDDDNVLASDYLENACQLAERYPNIGVFGGNSIPEFEKKPEVWVEPYLKYLALREVDRDYWSNVISAQEAEPCGAGMCILKDLALSYQRKTQENTALQSLDRRGDSLISGGDTNMVLSVLEDGLGMGMFKDLRLIHIIPERRVQENYIFRLLEDMRFSHLVLAYNLKRPVFIEEKNLLSMIKGGVKKLTLEKHTYRAYQANKRAEIRFSEYVKHNGL